MAPKRKASSDDRPNKKPRKEPSSSPSSPSSSSSGANSDVELASGADLGIVKRFKKLTKKIRKKPSVPETWYNRALSFQQTGYKELAVADAYRAWRFYFKPSCGTGQRASDSVKLRHSKILGLLISMCIELGDIGAAKSLFKDVTSPSKRYLTHGELKQQITSANWNTLQEKSVPSQSLVWGTKTITRRQYPWMERGTRHRDMTEVQRKFSEHGNVILQCCEDFAYGVYAEKFLEPNAVCLYDFEAPLAMNYTSREDVEGLPEDAFQTLDAANLFGTVVDNLIESREAFTEKQRVGRHVLASRPMQTLTADYNTPPDYFRFESQIRAIYDKLDQLALLDSLAFDSWTLWTIFWKVQTNCVTVTRTFPAGDDSDGSEDSDQSTYEEDHLAVYELFSAFNHSCEPNADIIPIDDGSDKMALQALRPILAGRQIFISYISQDDLSLGYKERSKVLLEWFGRPCKCDRCVAEEGRAGGSGGGESDDNDDSDEDDDNDDGDSSTEQHHEQEDEEDQDEDMEQDDEEDQDDDIGQDSSPGIPLDGDYLDMDSDDQDTPRPRTAEVATGLRAPRKRLAESGRRI